MKTNTKRIILLVIALMFLTSMAHAKDYNILDEWDPRNPDTESMLEYYDNEHIKETGINPYVDEGPIQKGTCYREACPVWAKANIAEQLFYLYVNGSIQNVWAISSGKRGYETPRFDQNPNGRIYDKYSSITYPGGDYNGLGNMPYAVFISGGYAVHGTLESNWGDLGKPASKGCVRLHPDHAFIFNRLVRSTGVGGVWITVE